MISDGLVGSELFKGIRLQVLSMLGVGDGVPVEAKCVGLEHGDYPWRWVLRACDCGVPVMMRSADLEDSWGFVSQDRMTQKQNQLSR
jgi:hypothetical protein